jgi:hypothetical protein
MWQRACALAIQDLLHNSAKVQIVLRIDSNVVTCAPQRTGQIGDLLLLGSLAQDHSDLVVGVSKLVKLIRKPRQ